LLDILGEFWASLQEAKAPALHHREDHVRCPPHRGKEDLGQAEFDRFADEYQQIHAKNIALSGEGPEFFARYKVQDTAALLASLGLSRPRRILDFGAGVGNSVPHFAALFPDAELTCVDVSHKSLALVQARFPSLATPVEFNGRQLPFATDSFDLVFSACVFHHIAHEEHDGLLRELHRTLRPGGIAVIFEHNPYNPLTVRAVNTCPFDNNAHLIDAGALQRQIAAAGFAEQLRRYRMFFPGMLRGARPLERFLAWLPLGAQYFVAARKAVA